MSRARLRPAILVAVSVGGMVGASLRYGVSRALPTAAGAFPWATLLANVSGSFLLATALVTLSERFPPSTYIRPFVATGLLGSYTTFSALVVEGEILVRDGQTMVAVTYWAASTVAGLVAAFAGFGMARLASSRTAARQPGEPGGKT